MSRQYGYRVSKIEDAEQAADLGARSGGRWALLLFYGPDYDVKGTFRSKAAAERRKRTLEAR